nr:MAG TPA: hypothetical protein [Caudoviricetes sp.]
MIFNSYSFEWLFFYPSLTCFKFLKSIEIFVYVYLVLMGALCTSSSL